MSNDVKRKAQLFVDGFEKGREYESRRSIKSMAYARKRIAYLARWRRIAIDRLALGPKLITEIDRTARTSNTTHG